MSQKGTTMARKSAARPLGSASSLPFPAQQKLRGTAVSIT